VSEGSQRVSLPPFNLGVSEAATAVTVLYFGCVASFNAGYFSRVEGRFVELFSFTDLVGSNIAIFEYVFWVFTIYCMLSIIGLFFIRPIERLRTYFQNHVRKQQSDLALTFLFFMSIFIIVILGLLAVHLTENTYFSIELAIYAFFQITTFYTLWTGYNLDFVGTRTLAFGLVAGLISFSHISGNLWLKYEIATPAGIQSLVLQDGLCLNRKVLRSGTNGLLLYNFSLKEFELRSRDSIKAIFQKSTCA